MILTDVYIKVLTLSRVQLSRQNVMPSTGIEPTRYGESTLHSSDVEFDYYTKEKEGCSNSAYKLAVPQIYWESSQL